MSDKSHKPASSGSTTTTTAAPTTSGPATSNAAAQSSLSGQSAYEGALGSKVGGFLFNLVDKNLSSDKIDGFAGKGIRSGTDFLGDFVLENATEEDMELAREFQEYLGSTVAPDLAERFALGGGGEGIADWAASSPWSMLGIGALGAAGFIASDQDIDFDSKHKFGKSGAALTYGADLGSTLDPGFDAARLGLEYRQPGMQAFVKGEQRFDEDAWSVAAGYRRQADWGNLAIDAAHNHTPDLDRTTAGIDWRNERHNAYLNGTYDQSADGNLGTLRGGVRTIGDDPLQWNTGFEADTNGRWNLGAGISHVNKDNNTEWFARASGGQNSAGDSDLSARLGFSMKF